MRTDDLRLFTAALVLLLTGAFLTTPAKADERPGHCAFGRPSSPPRVDRDEEARRAEGGRHTDRGGHTGHAGHAARWTAPTVRYRLSAGYAARGHHWRRRHTGQDFAVDAGTPVYAVGAGRVVAASCGDGFGNQVVLRHPDGYYTQYAHLSVINVRAGQRVSTGQRIGAAGATGNADGPHLHFEVRTGPHPGSAVPPLPWLRRHGVRVPGTASAEHPHPHPAPSTPATAPAGPTPAPGRPAAPARDLPAGHGRPTRTPGTPAPRQTPAKPWFPTAPWDPAALWSPAPR
ncbi:peptidoglycan DD-metalloendopeptidase family protein [Streptomyces fuscichromogenes]|uniref:M23 family metallopeptidase n=1 Tax=Streptomyces fuscichromogenes TaxID=1324013 RepID=UPI003803E6EB